MGTKKISELVELETLNDDDLIPIVDNENEQTKKITFTNFKDGIIKTFEISGITDNNGFLITSLPKNTKIISALASDTSMVIPYNDRTNNRMSLKILSWDMSPIAQTQVSVDVSYLV